MFDEYFKHQKVLKHYRLFLLYTTVLYPVYERQFTDIYIPIKCFYQFDMLVLNRTFPESRSNALGNYGIAYVCCPVMANTRIYGFVYGKGRFDAGVYKFIITFLI